MFISCPNCTTRFSIPDDVLGEKGRTLKCAKCGHKWFQTPESGETASSVEDAFAQPNRTAEPPASPVVESAQVVASPPVQEKPAPTEPPPAPSIELAPEPDLQPAPEPAASPVVEKTKAAPPEAPSEKPSEKSKVDELDPFDGDFAFEEVEPPATEIILPTPPSPPPESFLDEALFTEPAPLPEPVAEPEPAPAPVAPAASEPTPPPAASKPAPPPKPPSVAKGIDSLDFDLDFGDDVKSELAPMPGSIEGINFPQPFIPTGRNRKQADFDLLADEKVPDDLPSALSRKNLPKEIVVPKKSGPLWVAAGLLFVGLAGFGAYVFQQDIIHRWPQTAFFYEKTHLLKDTIPGNGLVIRDQNINWLAQDKTQSLVIRGTLVNLTSQQRPFPAMVLDLYTNAGTQIQTQTFPPQQGYIAAGAQETFRLLLSNPDPMATGINISFVAAPSSAGRSSATPEGTPSSGSSPVSFSGDDVVPTPEGSESSDVAPSPELVEPVSAPVQPTIPRTLMHGGGVDVVPTPG